MKREENTETGVKTEVTGADETVIATGLLSSHSLSCDHPALAAEITEAREAALPEVIRRTDEVRSFTCPFLHSSLPSSLPPFLPSTHILQLARARFYVRRIQR